MKKIILSLVFFTLVFISNAWAKENYKDMADFLNKNTEYHDYVELSDALYPSKCESNCTSDGEYIYDYNNYYLKSPIRKTIHADFNEDGIKDYVAIIAKPLKDKSQKGVTRLPL